MRSEPHRIMSPMPPPIARIARMFYLRDEDGIVHVVREYVRPVLGRDSNIIEESIEVTDCDCEVDRSWRRREHPTYATCIECVGRP